MKTVEWVHNKVRIIDQTRLPLEEVFVEYDDYRDVALAIKTMKVRGAPAIGVTAAFGVALAALSASGNNFTQEVLEACDVLGSTRPTAVNLFWAIDKMRQVIGAHQDENIDDIKALLLKEALRISESDEDMCRRMGAHGNTLIPEGARILTH